MPICLHKIDREGGKRNEVEIGRGIDGDRDMHIILGSRERTCCMHVCI